MADHTRTVDPATGREVVEVKADYELETPPWPARRQLGQPVGATSQRERTRRDRAAAQRETRRERKQAARRRFHEKHQAERKQQ